MIDKLGCPRPDQGWPVNLEAIPRGSVVISAGLGNSFRFEEALIRLKDCTIIGIDPNALARETYARRCATPGYSEMFRFIPAALTSNGRGIPFSTQRSNGSGVFDSRPKHQVPGISIREAIGRGQSIGVVSLLKMNIEGSEYPAIEALLPADIDGVPQVHVYFHHRKSCVPYGLCDTKRMVRKLRGFGYETIYNSDPFSAKADFIVIFQKTAST
jgi:hypothetical protein